ncbi:MAG: hypothetical protein P4L85_27245 [Paludisphaera borealis]|uniref:hypothetical protein n=1 Tax=Paludisphaera borealis TaxID=1387353 RepID=UPI002845EFD7|nr:hypothetical protein [Paludisphaera borealis]MDR3623079.1 hypothetical protein [Paludisphaera borealis]
MKSPIATLALLGSLAGGTAWAQTAPKRAASEPPAAAELHEDAVQSAINAPTVTAVPEPTPVDQLKAPTIDLPNDPIEPYLLTKNNGPFMVMAKVFRGPDSQKMALALCKELREEYHLPAYILRDKDWPGKHNIRGIPPQADPRAIQGNVKIPEKFRTYDEAAVLVGDEKTLKASEQLHHKVKKIKPKCLEGMSSIFPWRDGLIKSIRTTNPYVAAQDLFPHKRDDLIVRMNTTAWSIANCPGQYTLQVAEFSGRTTFNEKDENFRGPLALLNSPLRKAAGEAEELAAALKKDREVQQLGQPIYVFHDRTASRVYIGSFQTDRDPQAVQVREALVKMAVPLMDRKRTGGAVDTMIVPATMLQDLSVIKTQFEK